MRWIARLSLVALVLAGAGCFHQIVTTGRTPGTTVIEKPWTVTFIFGLVAAEEINTAAQCPNGVATVETQQSFLNGLVGGLTLGIYTPQDVRITCASGTAMVPGARHIDVTSGAPIEARERAIADAIEMAESTHAPVVVRY